MDLSVTILGNNSALPGFGRHPTAQAVSVGNETFLFDCGEGTQIQMQRFNVRWKRIRHIFISHLHGDHYFGLAGLLNSMSLMGRTDAVHLYAPATLEIMIQQMLDVADAVLSYPLVFHNLIEGEAKTLAESSLFEVSCFPVEHRIQCHGFKVKTKPRERKILAEACLANGVPHNFYAKLRTGIDFVNAEGETIPNSLLTEKGPEPKMYAYSADTIFTESYLPYIAGADLLYNESTYLQDNADKAAARFHCTSVQAAEIALKAGVKKLLLGHFSSKYRDLKPFEAEARTIFPESYVSEEGQTYTI